MTESGLASISSFYPISSADAESGLNSTGDVLEADSNNTETLRPTTWEILSRLVNDIKYEHIILNCSSTLSQQVLSFLIGDWPKAYRGTSYLLINADKIQKYLINDDAFNPRSSGAGAYMCHMYLGEYNSLFQRTLFFQRQWLPVVKSWIKLIKKEVNCQWPCSTDTLIVTNSHGY